MTDETVTTGAVEKLENNAGDEQEPKDVKKGTVVGPDFQKLFEAAEPLVELWSENQDKQRQHQLKMAQEQNSYNEKLLAAHKSVFSWQFWTVSVFLGAILLSGLYLLVFSEKQSEQGMLIVSHFAFGIFGVIAGFGIKSASNKQT